MRPKERIVRFCSILLRNDNIEKVFNIWGIDIPDRNQVVNRLTNDIASMTFDMLWEETPDLRFSQVLVNNGYVPNIPGMWYYMEEPDILVRLGYRPQEAYFWGQNFDKDMNLLPKTKYKPICELTTDHIIAIVEGGFVDRNPFYKQLFMDELKFRGKEL